MSDRSPGSKPGEIERLFQRTGALIGMIHLRPLPGSPHYRREDGMAAVVRQALAETDMLEAAGYDGVIVENAWDIPFLPPDLVGPETVAGLSVAVGEVVAHTTMPVGVNCLANAVQTSVAVAAATGAAFVRANQWVNAYVANEGFVEGRAGQVTRYRRSIQADDISVWADVKVKLGSHALTADRSLSEQARDAEWFDADALIVTGSRLADPPLMPDLHEIRSASGLSLVVGSGVTATNVAFLLSVAEAAIVGSALKEDGVWSGSMSEAAVRAIARARDGVDTSVSEARLHDGSQHPRAD